DVDEEDDDDDDDGDAGDAGDDVDEADERRAHNHDMVRRLNFTGGEAVTGHGDASRTSREDVTDGSENGTTATATTMTMTTAIMTKRLRIILRRRFLSRTLSAPRGSLPATGYSLGKTYSPAESRSPAAQPVLASNDAHHDVDVDVDDDDDDDGCYGCCCCCCCCCGGVSGGGGDSNNGPPRLKNTRVLAHSRPDDTMSRCCGTKIGAAGPHGVFRAARLTSRNPPHTTIDPNGGRTDVRTDGQAGRQARRNHG
ncbi:hypothetical protein ALC56_08460, partial [Trachymyrmex septentrionalis]